MIGKVWWLWEFWAVCFSDQFVALVCSTLAFMLLFQQTRILLAASHSIMCQFCRKFKFQMMQIIQIATVTFIHNREDRILQFHIIIFEQWPLISQAQGNFSPPLLGAGWGWWCASLGFNVLTLLTLSKCAISVLLAVNTVRMLKLLVINLLFNCQQIFIFTENHHL